MSCALWRDSNALCIIWSLAHVVDQADLTTRSVKLNNGKSIPRIFPTPLIGMLKNKTNV